MLWVQQKKNLIMKQLIINIEKYVIQYRNNNKIDLKLYKRKIKNHGVSQIIGPRYLNYNLKNAEITIFPSKYFYPISWHRINYNCIKTRDINSYRYHISRNNKFWRFYFPYAL